MAEKICNSVRAFAALSGVQGLECRANERGAVVSVADGKVVHGPIVASDFSRSRSYLARDVYVQDDCRHGDILWLEVAAGGEWTAKALAGAENGGRQAAPLRWTFDGDNWQGGGRFGV